MVKPKTQTPPLTSEQAARFAEIARDAVHNFSGTSDELEAALGMYVLGIYMGWKPLVLMHSKEDHSKVRANPRHYCPRRICRDRPELRALQGLHDLPHRFELLEGRLR